MTDRGEPLSGPPDIEYALLVRLESGHDWPPAMCGALGAELPGRHHQIATARERSESPAPRPRVARDGLYVPKPGSWPERIIAVLLAHDRPVTSSEVWRALGATANSFGPISGHVEAAMKAGVVFYERRPASRGVWSVTAAFRASQIGRQIAAGSTIAGQPPRPGTMADRVLARLRAGPATSAELVAALHLAGDRALQVALRTLGRNGLVAHDGRRRRTYRVVG